LNGRDKKMTLEEMLQLTAVPDVNAGIAIFLKK
jgi:hypothetical protein